MILKFVEHIAMAQRRAHVSGIVHDPPLIPLAMFANSPPFTFNEMPSDF